MLHDQIGVSVTGTVYRAYQPTINRYVALKLIAMPVGAHRDDAQSFERRFAQEAQVLASLEHPHIVPLYHYGIIAGEQAYVAMRLMRQSLGTMLAEGLLTPDRVTDIALQLLDGLGYAHQNRILHRDIKPGNILFDEAGSACLADFGLARVVEETLNLNVPAALRGEAIYYAPEQIRGGSIDERCDIYSLGVVMYQMLTGHMPFEAEDGSVVGLLRHIEFEEPLPPRKFNPNINPALERVVLQALRKEPRERFFDVQEMVNALEATPSSLTGARRLRAMVARPAARKQTPFWHVRRYQVAVAAFVGAGVLIVLITLATSNLHRTEPVSTTTVLAATRGALADAAPSADEIAQAQRWLGDTGAIAYIACGLDSEFETTRARDMSDRAAQYGVGFRVYDSENDPYRQLTLIERARIDNARAIIICPLKPNALADSLTSLHSANIPFVLTNLIDKNRGGVMLDANDDAVGGLAGHFVADTLATKTVAQPNIVILDAPDYAFSQARVHGFIESLNERLSNAKVVSQLPTAANQAASQSAISALLASGQHIDAIFSVLDVGAYGAISALDAAHIDREAVPVVSVNAESAALNDIYNGDYLRASVDIASHEGSHAALDAAVKLLGGGTLPEILTLPSGIVITRDIILAQSTGQ